MRRLLLCGSILAAVLVAACGGVNQKKLEPAYRAAKAVEVGTTGGASYLDFAKLVQALDTEIAVVRDTATPPERNVLEDYDKAARMYRDSLLVWQTKIRGERVPSLATDYGIVPGTPHEERIAAIWKQAGVWLEAGHQAYRQ